MKVQAVAPRVLVVLLVGITIGALVPASSSALERHPVFARGGLGAGWGLVSASVGGEEPGRFGAGLQWDGALGAFATRWLALHASAFGSVAPNAYQGSSCVDNCGPPGKHTIWSQTVGGGLTLIPAHGIGHSGVRPFFSTSVGLAVAGGPLMRGSTGTGAQLLLGLDFELTPRLRVGLAPQLMYAGRRNFPAQRAGPADGYGAWRIGLTVMLSFDRR